MLHTAFEPDAKPQVARGTPESAAYFNSMLEEIGETKATLARLMKRKGDDRDPATILRSLQRMATGDARVSGEMRVLLTILLSGKRKAMKRAAAQAPAAFGAGQPPPHAAH